MAVVFLGVARRAAHGVLPINSSTRCFSTYPVRLNCRDVALCQPYANKNTNSRACKHRHERCPLPYLDELLAAKGLVLLAKLLDQPRLTKKHIVKNWLILP